MGLLRLYGSLSRVVGTRWICRDRPGESEGEAVPTDSMMLRRLRRCDFGDSSNIHKYSMYLSAVTAVSSGCGAVVYGPPLTAGCRVLVLVGPAAVRTS
jgi:hypothetical protein